MLKKGVFIVAAKILTLAYTKKNKILDIVSIFNYTWNFGKIRSRFATAFSKYYLLLKMPPS